MRNIITSHYITLFLLFTRYLGDQMKMGDMKMHTKF